jgi:cytochrome c oxidase subunit 3
MDKKLLKSAKHGHSFHLVDPSPWPLLGSLSAVMITFSGVAYMHGYIGGGSSLVLGFISLFVVLWGWWRDIVREATFEGQHTRSVQTGLRSGMILFIVSEVMFFVAFFWAFFHSSLSPSPFIGGVWPPAGLSVLNPWDIPLLNTVILLSSGATVTWAHHALVFGSRKQGLIALFFTLVLAFFFTGLQGLEYLHAPFNISDGIYGSTFYMATGFHGFHVLVGSLFLAVSTFRLFCHHFTRSHHFGFEGAAWYWHFVDVVWLFLFISIYWWGGA